ncbi:hypothetical protein OAN96_00315 [Candidatus Gracilibacteria bacterium]|nr:hypothetical protein [Candidatus Gracilibacteria bacterium]
MRRTQYPHEKGNLDWNLDAQFGSPSEIFLPTSNYMSNVVQFLLERKEKGSEVLQNFNSDNFFSPIISSLEEVKMYEEKISKLNDDQLKNSLFSLLGKVSTHTYVIDNISFNDSFRNNIPNDEIRYEIQNETSIEDYIIGFQAVYTTLTRNTLLGIGWGLKDLEGKIDQELIEQIRIMLVEFDDKDYSFDVNSQRTYQLNHSIKNLLDQYLT